MAGSVLLLGLLMVTLSVTGAQGIGVCYGEIADNLPSQQEVVELYKQQNIAAMRIYWPNPKTLQALRGSNIQLMLGVPTETLGSLASDASAATQWVQANVVNYFPDVKIKYIVVSNEVSPNRNRQYVPLVLPAMQNIQRAIVAANLQGQIKVTLAFDTSVISNSYPPSHGEFGGKVRPFVDPIIQFLVRAEAPILVNVYPYFSYIGDRANIKLPYALFTNPSTVFTDDNGLEYKNLFDAILDSFYAALEKAGGSRLDIVVSESGWPSRGEEFEDTTENAATYYQNLINHVKGGSPKKPGKPIETYLFAMFNENNKEPELREKYFGLFLPTKQSKYQTNFS